jgi:hypothetical protein
MSLSNWIAVAIGVVLVAGFFTWLALRRNDPERAAGHSLAARTGSASFHGDPDDRPAGPGAEADGVAGPGEPAPGPTAESPPMPRP